MTDVNCSSFSDNLAVPARRIQRPRLFSPPGAYAAPGAVRTQPYGLRGRCALAVVCPLVCPLCGGPRCVAVVCGLTQVTDEDHGATDYCLAAHMQTCCMRCSVGLPPEAQLLPAQDPGAQVS